VTHLTHEEPYMTVTKAAALLRVSVAEVRHMVDHNEIESVVLIPATSVRSLIAGGTR
jgi:excisionase family DNA binding protein